EYRNNPVVCSCCKPQHSYPLVWKCPFPAVYTQPHRQIPLLPTAKPSVEYVRTYLSKKISLLPDCRRIPQCCHPPLCMTWHGGRQTSAFQIKQLLFYFCCQ